MDLILSIILLFVCILIAYIISKIIYDNVKNQKKEINWIYGIWIFLVIIVIILHALFKIKINDFTYLSLICIFSTLLIWRISLAFNNAIIAKIFIIFYLIFFAINIYKQHESNIYYLMSLYAVFTWIATVSFLTFKIKIK